MTPSLTPKLANLPLSAAPLRAPRPTAVDARVIGESIQRQVHDEGNARIGARMSAFFRLDEEREDDA